MIEVHMTGPTKQGIGAGIAADVQETVASALSAPHLRDRRPPKMCERQLPIGKVAGDVLTDVPTALTFEIEELPDAHRLLRHAAFACLRMDSTTSSRFWSAR